MGGHGVDDRFVYSDWNDGPVAGALPDELEVLICGDDESGTFVVATAGTHYYQDGKQVRVDDAFER